MPRTMKSQLRAHLFSNLILALSFHLFQYLNFSSAWLYAPSFPIQILFKTVDKKACRLRWHCRHNGMLQQKARGARDLWATKDEQRPMGDNASWRQNNHTNDDNSAIDHSQPRRPRYDLGLGKNRPKQGEEEGWAPKPHLAAKTSNGVLLTPDQTTLTAQNWMVPESVVKPLSAGTSSFSVTKISNRPNSYTFQSAAAAQQSAQSQSLPTPEVGNGQDSSQTLSDTVHRVVEKQPVTTRRMVA
jgi:hypothetical protein